MKPTIRSMYPAIQSVAVGISALGLCAFFFGLITLVVQLRTDRLIETLLHPAPENDRKSASRNLKKAECGTFKPGEDSFEITRLKGGTAHFTWAEVMEFHVFNRNLLNTNRLCLDLAFSGDYSIKINDELLGHSDLKPWLQRKFPVIPPNWVYDVALPVNPR